MTQAQDVQDWIGHDAIDQDGDKIGSIDEIYIDDASGQPEWVAVKTGLFGSKLSFVPIEGATRQDDDLCVPYSKDQVKDAPKVDPDGHLEPDEEDELYRHYGREVPTGGQQGGGKGQAQADAKGKGDGKSAGAGDSETMTRSEEELSVGTRSRETGKVRLRKYVVTENVTKTVPVQREEVRIEREPMADGEGGGELTDDEQEMTLHEEEVVTDKKVVGKEKVRLDKDAVSEEQQVSEEVRKEQIEMDEGDQKGTSRR